MTIGGTTRFGKSVLLRFIMTYLITHHPDEVEFYIIDLKGKLEFNRYRHLRQVKWIAGTPMEAVKLLNYLTNEDVTEENPAGWTETQMDYFEKLDIGNITETKIRKRKFVIIDEGAQLMPNDFTADNTARKICNYKLSRLASIAGALGTGRYS